MGRYPLLLFAPLLRVGAFHLVPSATGYRSCFYGDTCRVPSAICGSALRVATGDPSSPVFTTTDVVVGSEETLVDEASFLPPGVLPPSSLEDRLVSEQQRTDYGRNWLSEPSLWQGRAIVLSAAAIYGTNFATVKLLDQAMPMAASAALRFSLAAAVVTAAVLANEKDDNEATTAERGPATWWGAEVGAWYCVGYLCQAAGLHTADASKSAFFNALAVIVVPLLDNFFKSKQLGAKGMGSIALAIAGVAALQLGPALLNSGGDVALMESGDWFCLAQALFFGIGYWRLESTSSKYPNQAGRITAGQLLAVAAGSLAYVFAGPEHLPTMHELQGWLTDGFIVKSLLWTGLISTAMALYLETVALKVVSASELTILMTSISLWGSAFAYVTMGETMAPIGMLGGFMILSGCILSSTTAGDEKDLAP